MKPLLFLGEKYQFVKLGSKFILNKIYFNTYIILVLSAYGHQKLKSSPVLVYDPSFKY